MAPVFHGGVYCTLYLAPSDYHRVHAPGAGRVSAARHLRGTRWPVNPSAVRRVSGLFASNERLVLRLEDTAWGTLALVLVGACLVGGIRLNATPPFPVERGEELGRFEFGSTVIVLAPRAAGLQLAVDSGARVLMGEALMRAPAAVPTRIRLAEC
jgi:phosphatidylserine decarboxylase